MPSPTEPLMRTQPGLGSVPAFDTSMRSCLLGGKHRPQSEMGTRKLMGRARWVCKPTCDELQQRLEAATGGGLVSGFSPRHL